MSRQDVIDGAFQQFVQQFHMEEQRVLLAFYRELAGKRRIPYKIKDRNFLVNIQMSQGFALDVEFQDVLIEDGRHPKEIVIDQLRGERLADGRYKLSFMNLLSAQGENAVSKESAFSFASLKGCVRLLDYRVHKLRLRRDMKDLPWELMYETLLAIREKQEVLGENYMNDYEKELFSISHFMLPFLQLYLDPMTRIGFGKSTVLYEPERADWRFDARTCHDGAEFFAALGLRHISADFSRGNWNTKAFIQEVLYTMRTLKGCEIYRCLAKQMEACGKDYDGMETIEVDRSLFRAYVREQISKVFAEHGWEGIYPSYRRMAVPNFVEVSSVYKKQYTYLNEKQKFIYFDFIETVTDGGYQIVPVTGIILPKNREADYRKTTSLDCFFVDGGRRKGEVFEDLVLSENMERKQLRERLEQLGMILELQKGRTF